MKLSVLSMLATLFTFPSSESHEVICIFLNTFSFILPISVHKFSPMWLFPSPAATPLPLRLAAAAVCLSVSRSGWTEGGMPRWNTASMSTFSISDELLVLDETDVGFWWSVCHETHRMYVSGMVERSMLTHHGCKYPHCVLRSLGSEYVKLWRFLLSCL